MSRAAYTLCKKMLCEEKSDTKNLKELCSVLKEVISINQSLEKDCTDSGDTLRIIMEGDVGLLAR